MSEVVSDAAIADAFAWCRAWQERGRVPGVAFVVTDNTATRFVGLSGIADAVSRRPLSAEQRWQIGSISKAFTAIAILQLEAAGKLRLDDSVITHLPWAQHLSPGVTIHHLLTHTGGLPGGSEWGPDSRLETAMQGLVGNPQPPGGGFYYSNCGYEALGDVVEQLTGQPIETVLEQRVLRPLGMRGSVASVTSDNRALDVGGHRPPRDDELWQADSDQTPDQWFPTCTADGAIAATPEDLAIYLRFLINGVAPGVLNREQFDLLSGRHVRADEHSWYGYGLSTYDGPAELSSDGTVGSILGHGGAMVGMFADVRVDRARGMGTAVMVNGECDAQDANRYLLDRLRASLDATIAVVEPDESRTAVVDDAHGSAELTPMVGLYRSYNPWRPTIEIVRRGDVLQMADPAWGTREELTPLGNLRFRVGPPHSADVASFDVLVDDEYLRLELSGCVYARVRRRPPA